MWKKCVNAPQNFSPYIIAQLLQKVKRIWELLWWKKCWNLLFLRFRDNFRVILGIWARKTPLHRYPHPPPHGQPLTKVFASPTPTDHSHRMKVLIKLFLKVWWRVNVTDFSSVSDATWCWSSAKSASKTQSARSPRRLRRGETLYRRFLVLFCAYLHKKERR